GVIWPGPIAPFHVVLIPISVKDESAARAVEEIYAALCEASVEVLLDDRDERPGVKFKDADLMGVPFQLIIGPKGLAEGKVELKPRRGGAKEFIDLDRAAETVRLRVVEALSPAGAEGAAFS
ncbi:MAG: His/Gly/Thr/Pro-type tRNA ligase C-terminal domain-containing protein, partial [Nitrospinota bacterium]|nr:His/Gly/Thr/Pro-type tRNA ligase C-terminal domain-containing protein [Nitrospinota bacterium]